MKKLLILVAVLVLVMALFVACGGDDTTTTKPGTTTTEPETTTSKPETTTSKPETTTSKPETTTSKPETTTSKPETTTSKPETTTAAPATTVDPIVNTPVGGTCLNDVEGAIYSVAFEDHHASLDYKLAFVICINNADIYTDIAGSNRSENDWSNPAYTWVITINDKTILPTKFSLFNGSTWGYFRVALGETSEFPYASYDVTVKIIDNETKTCQYYATFEDITWGFVYDDAKPEGATPVAPSDITAVSGPDMDGDEGTKKMFDGKHNTKLCTADTTPVIFSLAEAKALTGFSLVTANDNNGGRLVTGFTVYGCNTNSATASDWTVVLDKASDPGVDGNNFTETYYAIEGAAAYQYYKVVFTTDGELFQFSEIWVYA